MYEHTKRYNYKFKKPIFNFLKKVPFIFKPADASVTIRGAGGQAPMVFGQAKGNKKPKKTSSYYLYGKKNHIAKMY